MARSYYAENIRKSAKKMRESGFSHKEISEKLKIAKSTACLDGLRHYYMIWI